MDENVFEVLSAINVNGKTETKDGLTYLSWADAWAEVAKRYPDSEYFIKLFGPEDNKLPYMYDPNLGYMVETVVIVRGVRHEMWLPVMDSKNKAMKAEPYTYKTKYGEKTVAAATMFDINKTIMRCLAKNLAMFGLGLYIYAGEDLPEREAEELKDMQTVRHMFSVACSKYANAAGVSAQDVVNSYANRLTNQPVEVWTEVVNELNSATAQIMEGNNGN